MKMMKLIKKIQQDIQYEDGDRLLTNHPQLNFSFVVTQGLLHYSAQLVSAMCQSHQDISLVIMVSYIGMCRSKRNMKVGGKVTQTPANVFKNNTVAPN